MSDWSPKPATIAIVAAAGEAIAEANSDGYRPTLRRVFYSLVSVGIIPNTERAYKNLSATLDRARWEGWLPFDCLDDLGRVADVPAAWVSPQQAVADAAYFYRTDWWDQADPYVELWAEKDAVTNIIEPVANRWGVPFLSCRGFASLTALTQAAERFDGRPTTILYAGDHDPSGLAMDVDLQSRLERLGCDIYLERVALTEDQIIDNSLPPQPTKTGDSRARGWTHRGSWELDALPAPLLVATIEEHLEPLAPPDLSRRRSEDDTNRELISAAARNLPSI